MKTRVEVTVMKNLFARATNAPTTTPLTAPDILNTVALTVGNPQSPLHADAEGVMLLASSMRQMDEVNIAIDPAHRARMQSSIRSAMGRVVAKVIG